MKHLVYADLSRTIVLNALRVSVVVGTVLNLINQGEAVLAGHAPSWLHVALNYLGPYLLASYSAARNELGSSQRARDALRPLQ
jgi:hypothetical protein